jgi:uncharacterized protein
MDYLVRQIEPTLKGLLDEVPAVLITGPRASGKTTTARRYAATVVQLDDPVAGEIFRRAPDVALRDLAEPVLLDEWQSAPEVIGAVKRAVDADPRPGRFLLTGSASLDLAGTTWPGTGRVMRLNMGSLSQRELQRSTAAPAFIDTLIDAPEQLMSMSSALDVGDYIDLALRSGFPEPALRLRDETGARWLDSYLEECFARDIPSMKAVRDPARLRRFFTAISANAAGIVDEKTLFDAAQIDRKTAVSFEAMFEAIGITQRIPAFMTNRLKRLVERPKRYVTDVGLMASALTLDRRTVLNDGDMLGRVIDNFVYSQMSAELPTLTLRRGRVHHLRDEGGRHEIDLVIDLGSQGLVAVEVKAAGAPTPHDARHLHWLKDQMGSAVVAAVVLHTGPRAYSLGDGVMALPISAMWSAVA